MDTIIAMMDVAAAVRAATGWARSLRGVEARVSLVGVLLVDIILGWLAWHFDIETTLLYAKQIHSAILATLAQSALVYAPLILIVITIAPTALRQTLAPVAKQLRMLAFGIILLNAFDARTDWPRVKELFDNPLAWDIFSFLQIGGSDALQGIAWGAARLFFLFLATDVFEVAFVAMVVATIILLVNSFRGPAAATGKTTRLKTP